MYDALYEMLGFERVAKSIERNIIEVAPLAFMRGRSLNDSFVILDEAQNTTNEQMKMFLTRIGFGSKAVVTGDITQVDLPNSKQSGLRTVIDILHGVRGIAFTMFSSRDVVRHPLVQRIVQAYEAQKRPMTVRAAPKRRAPAARARRELRGAPSVGAAPRSTRALGGAAALGRPGARPPSAGAAGSSASCPFASSAARAAAASTPATGARTVPPTCCRSAERARLPDGWLRCSASW